MVLEYSTNELEKTSRYNRRPIYGTNYGYINVMVIEVTAISILNTMIVSNWTHV